MAKNPHSANPVFPYATLPSVLRRILAEIPKRPRPPRLNETQAASWGLPKGGNTRSAIAVLKKIGLVSESGEPQDPYVDFMKTGTGPQALAGRIRQHYKVLFDASNSPQTDNNEALENLFNIHSGGSASAIAKQIQTFKALCEHADFRGLSGSVANPSAFSDTSNAISAANGTGPSLPPIKIDLHIHLPENKTTRDYEAIIQDIARYIYGRKEPGREPV